MTKMNKVSALVLITILIILPFLNLPVVSSHLYEKSDDFSEICQTVNLSKRKYEFVIITKEEFIDSDFKRLINHKSKYINATIVSLEDITSNSSFWVNGSYGDASNISEGNPWITNGKEVTKNFHIFNDTQAKIRNFIRYAYGNWDTKYVLLGGDDEIIPARFFHLNNVRWFSGRYFMRLSPDIASDLYFSSLNNTWNNDFDNYFGETSKYSTEDEADFISEVFVGRSPISNKYDISIFVDKVISFETEQKPNKILLHRSGINRINFPNTKIIPEKCAEYITNDFKISRLYRVRNKKEWIDAFKEKLIVLHVGCGTRTFYFIENRILRRIRFTIRDIYKMSNTFYPVHISISCKIGDFVDNNKEDCLAEQLLLCPSAGPSACIINTHYGFSTWWNAHKYSGDFIEKMFYEIFEKKTGNLGKIVRNCKQYFLDEISNDIGYRWCFYSINLLGDPEMSLFKTRN